MGILTFIGTVISIIAAIFSIYQAVKAKNSAQAAQDAKDSIEKYKSTLNLQKLLAHAKEIEALLVKLTAPNLTTGKGRNFKKDHEAIERFVSLLNDNQSIHPDSEFCTFILNEYEWFVAQASLDPKPYNDILYHVRAIIREINGIIHDRTFE
ncbi:MAG: hypothetical protein K2K45_03710 [Muribaculaceae bacterium]|nr:hypothetical protein [Muribaculaceae bacterium]